MCSCNREPEDDQDMEALMMDMAEQERELIDRAEAQQPDWLNVAKDLCLPSLAYQVAVGDTAP